MFDSDQYALLDFGEGRKLERFGSYLIDRPAPAAHGPREHPQLWQTVDARFLSQSTGRQGTWQCLAPMQAWEITADQLRLQLQLTEFGQLGLFPEHASHWEWLEKMIAGCRQPPQVLNLFGYTGATTLVAAQAGAAGVTHVDAARPAVHWARKNADLSNLSQARIRWLIEDVPTYVGRELKREQRYQGIILDPPSFGRGPRGQAWNFHRDLPALLENCLHLMQSEMAFLLLTCHTTGVTVAELAGMAKQLSKEFTLGEAGELRLTTSDQRHLPCGVFFRWPR